MVTARPCSAAVNLIRPQTAGHLNLCIIYRTRRLAIVQRKPAVRKRAPHTRTYCSAIADSNRFTKKTKRENAFMNAG
jgi:hypothetical protein